MPTRSLHKISEKLFVKIFSFYFNLSNFFFSYIRVEVLLFSTTYFTWKIREKTPDSKINVNMKINSIFLALKIHLYDKQKGF
jgi:hypothetical protein